ncbi:MAG: hypothetical protein H6681_02595 [Desulfobacteraceae bacterium]|nr:hypothetical protein [Desulfobacteraceae bacterium]MCB9494316.1 hypothetical protein [Desulfobacteraceae bacterium]
MAKNFRPSSRESQILSKIESSREREKQQMIYQLKEKSENLSNSISMKLIEKDLIETNNKNGLQKQIQACLEDLSKADDFDIDYKIAPIRSIVSNPNFVSLYLTAFIIEDLINHRDIIDIYGDDADIYNCVHKEVKKHLL